MSSKKLLDFGIAVNFIGNYKSASKSLDVFSSSFTRTMGALSTAALGGGAFYTAYQGLKGIFNTGLETEFMFANLNATLGSTAKVMSNIDWAVMKGVDTPFEIDQVFRGLTRLQQLGYAKTDEARKDAFNAIGDFAGIQNRHFEEATAMVTMAGFGSWRRLKMNFGIDRSTIGNAIESKARFQQKSDAYKKHIREQVAVLKVAKGGTDAYKNAVVELIQAYSLGGMEERMKTFAGVWSNMPDIFFKFKMAVMGFSQIKGDFMNAITNTLKVATFDKFQKAIPILRNGEEVIVGVGKKAKKTATAMDMLSNIGKGIGRGLTDLWRSVDYYIGNATDKLINYIRNLDDYMSDYNKHIAPIVLVIRLVSIEVGMFFNGLKEGFSTTFGYMWRTTKRILGLYKKVFGMFDDGSSGKNNKAKEQGKFIGQLLGIVIGIKAVSLVLSPVISIMGILYKVGKPILGLFEGMAGFMGLTGEAGLLATTPIGWIVAAIALIAAGAYLIYTHWDSIYNTVKPFALILKKLVVNDFFMMKNIVIFIYKRVKLLVLKFKNMFIMFKKDHPTLTKIGEFILLPFTLTWKLIQKIWNFLPNIGNWFADKFKSVGEFFSLGSDATDVQIELQKKILWENQHVGVPYDKSSINNKSRDTNIADHYGEFQKAYRQIAGKNFTNSSDDMGKFIHEAIDKVADKFYKRDVNIDNFKVVVTEDITPEKLEEIIERAAYIKGK